MKKREILDFLRQNKKALREKYGVTKIGLFGSVARDESDETSDIDIVVELESPNRFRSFFNLKYHLEKAFGKEVDLGVESSLKPIVKERVKREIIYV